jgi:2-dehydro-3-deoxyphosphogluconate aldolase/(4S)-4-hydroxy-2-oxoglutarate aldolase
VVSPGVNPALLEAADEFETPYLPGSSTASEAMTLFEFGYRSRNSSRPSRRAAWLT